ncbi:MAG: DoxX family protein [Weeksellaceae bacterium]
MIAKKHTTLIQNIVRIILGLFMLYAGIGHVSFLREEFQAQVPVWLPLGKDFVVVASGIVEIALGLAMILWTHKKTYIGIALAIFYVLVFPGNINQYVEGIDSFGLDTDQARLIRLFFQPILIWLALWSTGFFNKRKLTR